MKIKIFVVLLILTVLSLSLLQGGYFGPKEMGEDTPPDSTIIVEDDPTDVISPSDEDLVWVNQSTSAVNSSNIIAEISLTGENRLIMRGSEDDIYINIWNETETDWSGWSKLPGSTTDRPAAVTFNNSLHIVVRGIDSGIYHGSIDLESDVFSGWSKFPGGTPSAPSLAVTETGLILTIRGNNSGAYYSTYNGSWSGWTRLQGSNIDSIGTTVIGDTYHVMALSNNSKMYHGQMTVSTETWLGWTLMNGTTPSQPVLCNNAENIYLVIRGSDDGIYRCTYNGTWGNWDKLPGTTTQSPGATVYEGELWICVTGVNPGFFYSRTDLDTYEWSGWEFIEGSSPSSPTLIS